MFFQAMSVSGQTLAKAVCLERGETLSALLESVTPAHA